MTKRLITTLLAVAVLAAPLPVGAHLRVPHPPEAHQFDDLLLDHLHAEDVLLAANTLKSGNHWVNGTGWREFSPDRKITAEQMVKMLERAFPGGMTRERFAAFMVGGYERVYSTDLNGDGLAGKVIRNGFICPWPSS